MAAQHVGSHSQNTPPGPLGQTSAAADSRWVTSSTRSSDVCLILPCAVVVCCVLWLELCTATTLVVCSRWYDLLVVTLCSHSSTRPTSQLTAMCAWLIGGRVSSVGRTPARQQLTLTRLVSGQLLSTQSCSCGSAVYRRCSSVRLWGGASSLRPRARPAGTDRRRQRQCGYRRREMVKLDAAITSTCTAVHEHVDTRYPTI